MYQKVAMQLTEERQQHATVNEEFKQVQTLTVLYDYCIIHCCMKQAIKLLDEKNRSQQENLRKELQAVKVRPNTTQCY